MQHYSSKKRKISKIKEEEEEDQDRISNLFDDILLHILSFMNVKFAARTSVLSMRWRSLWTWLSSLDFSYWKSMKIDQCLHLHRTPKVRSFKIEKSVGNFDWNAKVSSKQMEASHRWVHFAGMHEVEELSLGLPGEHFPVSLLECQTLSHLILKRGIFHFTGEFLGFKSLVTLCLEYVWIDIEVLNLLISKCDLLENLKVAECRFGDMLLPKICANHSSRLRNLEIIFDGTSLKGLEVVAPGILFISSKGELQVTPSIFPRFSWEADAEGWRCRESSISCVEEKNLLFADQLLRAKFESFSVWYMRIICRFQICGNKVV
ncbi:hypothetical protein AAC387_Pa06g2381 [Persea americana]